jgi:aspartyl-tRNA(Asn)/glutamyl-tRNA(Gln) amidotransferase subunit C
MSLTRKDVVGIAHLARLDITENELPVYTESLSKILSLVDQLNAAPTSGIEPMAHPLEGEAQRLRADVVTETDAHAKYQQNAPRVEGALYVVPRVIE